MTKSDLIEKISSIYPYMHTRNIETVVSIITNKIAESLAGGNRVELRGFGSFSVRERKETEGRNPKTGGKVSIERKKIPFFKAGKHLKDMINEFGESN
jgi:integration host factor subunit beta